MNSKLVKLEIVSRLTAPRCLQRYRETKAQLKRAHTGEITQIADYFCNTYFHFNCILNHFFICG